MQQMDSKQLEEIRKREERMAKHDKRQQKAIIQNKTEINDLVETVNSILAEYKITERITKKHIRFYADFIGNITLPINDKKLSEIIFDHYFPTPPQKTYYHFTSFEACRSIIDSGKIRLSNLLKRFNDGEFSEFYRDHNIDGYQAGGNVFGIDIGEKAVMSEIFFLSMTSSPFDFPGDKKWEDFGDSGRGLRISLELKAKHSDFREVYYSGNRSGNHIPLLKSLETTIQAKYHKPLSFSYISKIGAFYIRGAFKNEAEYRLLIKTTADDYSASHLKMTVTDKEENIGYIELPLMNDFAEIIITAVQPGYNCSEDHITELTDLIKTKKLNIKTEKKALEDYDM